MTEDWEEPYGMVPRMKLQMAPPTKEEWEAAARLSKKLHDKAIAWKDEYETIQKENEKSLNKNSEVKSEMAPCKPTAGTNVVES